MEKQEYVLKTLKNGDVITVRNLQVEILDIMDEIHRICEKHNIKYCLIAGSALGICNYNGFIPWDDDMDICIDHKDLKKFIRALKKDLNKDFYFHCFDTDHKYNVLIPTMKIRKKNTYIEEVNVLLKNRCKGDGVFIDVVTYNGISENKFVDEMYRTYIKLLMPIMVLLDNMRINTTLLKKIVLKIADKYAKKNKNSKYVSQTIAIPWEKFLHEPVFLREDVYPFKLYDFEGRKYYSYNNIEKVMKQWYGPNCLKKWNGKEYVETLPVEKRHPKHVKDINLKSDVPNKKHKSKIGIFYCVLLFLIALILFNEVSFLFLGLSLIILGMTLMYFINKN